MKTLQPILVRANVPNQLQELRKNIASLKTYPDRTPEDLLYAEELSAAHDQLKRQFIFVISSQELPKEKQEIN